MSEENVRDLSKEQLAKEIVELYREQFNLKIQKATGQLTKTHNLRKVRRKIAQLKTIKHEKMVNDNE